MKKMTTAWLAAARDDLTLIREISHQHELTHLVAFHAQQAIEKTFKAILEEFEGFVPRMHNLETLYPKVASFIPLTDDESDLFEELDKLYIDARYPGDLGLLPDGKPTIADVEGFERLAQSVFEIVCRRLEQRRKVQGSDSD